MVENSTDSSQRGLKWPLRVQTMVRNAGETDQCVYQASVRTQVVSICNLRAPPGRWEKETEKSQDASSGQARVVSVLTNRAGGKA